MFKPFSGTVSALYERASHAEPRAFPAEALQLVRGLIVCDGAMLSIGDKNGVASRASIFAARHGDDGRLARDESDAAVQVCDPLASAFRFAPDGPLAWDTDGCTQAGVRQLLVHGDAAARKEGRWIVLYRMHDRGFDEHDAEMLHALWPHVRQAIAFNRQRARYRTAAKACFPKTAATGERLEKRWRIPQFLRAGMHGLIERDMRCGF